MAIDKTKAIFNILINDYSEQMKKQGISRHQKRILHWKSEAIMQAYEMYNKIVKSDDK
mgnify:CR=1 FL=1